MRKPVRHFLKNSNLLSMIRLISALAATGFALISASCCCTGEPKAPPLRPLPQFQEIETTDAPAEVHYAK